MRLIPTLFALLLPIVASAADWRTDAEISGYQRTPPHAESLAWLRRLADASAQLRVESFGTSPEGRELVVVIASADGSFTPDIAKARGKRVLLVQAGIHAGEIEGKDAGMALLRDLTVAGKHTGLLDDTVLVFIPVFNVDGHERSSRYNRINQNGPQQMGWRATAQNLNLNRDHLKADAPEMRAWLALWTRWSPDLFIDVHTTNGADYQYVLTWYLEEWGNQAQAVRDWQRDALIGRVFPATERHGHLLGPYINLIDNNDIRKGLVNFGSGPRFSTGYAALRNRPGILVETHMLKPYAQRVKATHALLLEVLRELDRHGAALRTALAAADAAQMARSKLVEPEYAVAYVPTTEPQEFTLRGVPFTQTRSEISGDTWTHYEPGKRLDLTVPFLREMVVAASVRLPAAYVIKPAAIETIDRIRAHGLQHFRLAAPQAVRANGWRIAQPQWTAAPFEGRIGLREFQANVLTREFDLPAGSVVVPMDQAASNVAAHLLEPQAPDSLLRWGFYNAHFERKEYADARKLEELARAMLADDPALREQFEQRLQDPAFAADPRARLDFFFMRSPYADPELGVLPVWRIDTKTLERLRESAVAGPSALAIPTEPSIHE